MAKRQKQDPRLSPPIYGWVLVARDEGDMELPARDRPWYIAWHEVFPSRRNALDFAGDHMWPKGYRAVRGSLLVEK